VRGGGVIEKERNRGRKKKGDITTKAELKLLMQQR
jgi:hypothetical protein